MKWFSRHRETVSRGLGLVEGAMCISLPTKIHYIITLHITQGLWITLLRQGSWGFGFQVICKTLHKKLEKGVFAGILESGVLVLGIGLKLLNLAGNQEKKKRSSSSKDI